ncbi:MAG: helix-turn-helix transcriptional regulator [Anaerolineae bacterium]
MQATRAQIVEHLKQRGRATIQDLTTATELTSMTVRHHLTVLEADGLVSSAKERGHVGRPRHVYFLTENALSLFPERYDELADRLLKGLKALGARREVTEVLEEMGADIVRTYHGALAGKSFEERLDLLIHILSDEGFLASWVEEAGKYILTEYSCPYLLVGQDHPEVCEVDWQVITRILGAPVKKETCMLQGDTNCTFHIRPKFDIAVANISAG